MSQVIGDLISQMLDVREQKAALKQKEKELNAELDFLKREAIEQAHLMGVDSLSIKGIANITVTTKEIPVVNDWDAFYEHVKQTEDFSLLQKRLSSRAVLELMGPTAEDRAGSDAIPGVGIYEEQDLSIRKI